VIVFWILAYLIFFAAVCYVSDKFSPLVGLGGLLLAIWLMY